MERRERIVVGERRVGGPSMRVVRGVVADGRGGSM